MQKMLACLAAALFSFYNLFELCLFNKLNSALQTHFHLTTQGISLLSSSFLWANAIGLIPIGMLLDRGYARRTALCLLILAVLSNFIFIFSNSVWLATFARFIQGFSSAGSLLICLRLGTHWYPKNTNTAIGFMIAIALSGGIISNFANTWVTPIILGIIIFIIILSFLREAPSAEKPYSYRHNFLLKPQNFLIGGYLACINFPVFILGALWSNIYLSQQFHIHSSQQAYITSLIFLGIIIGSPLWGLLANRYLSPRNILLIGCIGLIFLCSLLQYIHPSLISLSVIFFNLGFFCCTQNIAYYILNQINSPSTISSGTAIASVVFNALGAFSQIIFYSVPLLIFYPILAFGILLFLFLISKGQNNYLLVK